MAELTVERLFSDPPLFTSAPQQPQFTPDGTNLAYLRPADEDRERLDLWRVHLDSGRHEIWLDARALSPQAAAAATAAEQAERERRRQFSYGITAYLFSPCGRYLLLPIEGAGVLVTLSDGQTRTITPPGTRQTDLRFTPGGDAVCWVRGGNLYRYDIDAGTELPLTVDGGGTVRYGLADFIAQEEMHRFEGYWWSPDGSWIAYTRVDEGVIAESLRYDLDTDGITVVAQRYPYAGLRNADVRLYVRRSTNGQTHEVDFRADAEDYLARVSWIGQRLAVQRQSRDQQRLDLLAFDPETLTGEVLLSERSSTWVNLHDNLTPVPAAAATAAAATAGDERLLWTSQRDGPSRLYLWDSGELRPLTEALGRVQRVHWADATRALVSGWFETPTEQHLYEISLDGDPTGPRRPGLPRRLTPDGGWHEAVVDRCGLRAACRMSSLSSPGELLLVDTRADAPPRPPTRLQREVVDAAHAYFPYLTDHVTPELGTLTAEDGQTLHYRLTRPSAATPATGAPVIVYVYGGPGAQRVKNEWPPALLQLFSRHGFGVLELDNRGTTNRDRDFEAPIHRRLGTAEVRDQAVGARFLAEQGWVDAARIGIFGHSYGGYMTLMCLMQRPDLFKAGVAVAPVTDWALYDTHYTERYLGTPADNADGYRQSSVLHHLDGFRGRLLLVHGMADDNVLFTHSTRLIQALQARALPFELMLYPGSKHALQERHVSIHRFKALLDFFRRNL
jgi:dipeptidyl-peptidase 4